MNTPKVSIITINYNDVEGLKATLTSVKEQSYSHYEFLVIDGASNDGSKEYIEAEAEHIDYWISEPDTGIYNAQNKGIVKATGDYLLFLNSGDTFYTSKALEEFVGHPNFKGDIIYGDYKYEKGEKIFADTVTPYYFMKTSLPHQSTLFHKKVFELMGNYDESYRLSADRAFYLKCLLSGKISFQHIKYPLALFDLSGVSNSPEHLAKKQAEDDRFHRELFGVYYEDMKALYEANQEISRLRKLTPKGILKRIKHKLFK
ncbi:glycosyltransferase family 2 protein [Aureisphaera galaxeae]|uniref:glycosyltransferase family 2 protein n=1 Tax=Aureisphaera galaxeae TaxID=1538023 RepID=UPI002350D531|nr:glycosyltransferase family 2 protein [Aureisphaera galaxeae]MDC8006291.1 glycosyltransferase family 2 protein [Aureisphaera galaxeae]